MTRHGRPSFVALRLARCGRRGRRRGRCRRGQRLGVGPTVEHDRRRCVDRAARHPPGVDRGRRAGHARPPARRRRRRVGPRRRRRARQPALPRGPRGHVHAGERRRDVGPVHGPDAGRRARRSRSTTTRPSSPASATSRPATAPRCRRQRVAARPGRRARTRPWSSTRATPRATRASVGFPQLYHRARLRLRRRQHARHGLQRRVVSLLRRRPGARRLRRDRGGRRPAVGAGPPSRHGRHLATPASASCSSPRPSRRTWPRSPRSR